MYKVFLADDEDIIRDGIRSVIERNGNGLSFCGEAPDGELALPLIQELKPDILITDVRMPFMDGLELSVIVKKTMPWIHIIILSGHDEFEYAQKSVSIGVDAYVLKPVNSDEILKTLYKTIQRIDEEKRDMLSRKVNSQKEDLEKNLAKEYFFSRIIGGTLSITDALNDGKSFEIDLIAKKYIACYVDMPALWLKGDNMEKIRNITTSLFENRENVYGFIKGGDSLALLITGNIAEETREKAYETACTLIHELDRLMDISPNVGIGSVVDRLSDVPVSYQKAQSVVGNGIFLKGSHIIGAEDVENKRISPSVDFFADMPLADKIKHAQMKDVDKIIHSQFGSLDDGDVQSVLYRYYLLMDIVVEVSRLIKEFGEKTADVLGSISDPVNILAAASDSESTISLAKNVLRDMIECRESCCKTIRYGSEIQRAREYIKEKYADPNISLHVVAQEAGFSPNHFSTVFSQETGETFVEYLTRTRIEKAKELLIFNDRKLSDIAFEIGYSEPQYFSYIFKKNTGVSPREYRQKQLKNGE